MGFSICFIVNGKGCQSGYQIFTNLISSTVTITGLVLSWDIYQAMVSILEEFVGFVGIVKLDQGRRTLYDAFDSRVNKTVEFLFINRMPAIAQRIFIYPTMKIKRINISIQERDN